MYENSKSFTNMPERVYLYESNNARQAINSSYQKLKTYRHTVLAQVLGKYGCDILTLLTEDLGSDELVNDQYLFDLKTRFRNITPLQVLQANLSELSYFHMRYYYENCYDNT